MLISALEYARANREQYREQLFELLRIPSISTLPEHRSDIRRAADWIADNLRSAGLQNVEVMPTNGNPVVYADWMAAGPDAETVLVYGHYDVQPVDPLDLWDTSPFDPQVRDGKVYARGASDDKGQMFLHIKAVESMLSNGGSLPVNLKMIFEGEEEIGSPNLEAFVLSHLDMLAANSSLI